MSSGESVTKSLLGKYANLNVLSQVRSAITIHMECVVQGEYYSETGVRCMSFPAIDCEMRTDASFRNRQQAQHHKEYSMFEELDIDMIQASDALHLIDLGIMKKCLNRWLLGGKGYTRKWNKATAEKVSDLLVSINAQMPSDMHRAVRSLDLLAFWKGVEFRNFLLYVGIVALKKHLNVTEYKHFLILYTAVTICSCNVYQNFIPTAKNLSIFTLRTTF